MESDRITAIYEEISKYVIQLEPNPASLGPTYLSDLIARCRNYLNATNLLVLEVHRERHEVQRRLTAMEAAYEIEASDLLANDERVRRLPNIDDRKATVAVILRDQLRVIQKLRGVIQDLDTVDKAVRFRHRELKDTMAEIKIQRSLIRDELDTKSFYGDERVPENSGRRPSLDIGELEALLDESVQHGLGTAPVSEPVPSPGPVAESTPLESYPLNGSMHADSFGAAEGTESASPTLGSSIEMTDADFDAILQNV